VLGLRIKERPPIWRVAANIFNKHSRTSNKGWSFSKCKNISSFELYTEKALDLDTRKTHLEDPDLNWSKILRWIFRKWDVEA